MLKYTHSRIIDRSVTSLWQTSLSNAVGKFCSARILEEHFPAAKLPVPILSMFNQPRSLLASWYVERNPEAESDKRFTFPVVIEALPR